uniref:F-box domain-containing protein n=1 Tax=Leptocylindrus danicus TaxID=163516 RepID=A0A7S2KMN7_9STRA
MKLSNDSLVYIVVDGELVFDRHRGGALAASSVDRKEARSVSIDETAASASPSKESVAAAPIYYSTPTKYSGSFDAKAAKEGGMLASQLPVSVLEHILRHLPSHNVGIFPQVCKGWGDVGTTSTSLWRYLMLGHGWALPFNGEKQNDPSLWRDYYVSNFNVLRNVVAIKAGLRKICDPHMRNEQFDSTSKLFDADVPEATQVFKSTRHAPEFPNTCVSLKLLTANDPKDPYSYRYENSDTENNWSKHSVIGAYSHDGTLRVFESVADQRGRGASCRETVCVRAILKIKNLQMVAMDLDEDNVFCVARGQDMGSEYITVLSKQDIICGEGGICENGSVDPESSFQAHSVATLLRDFSRDRGFHATFENGDSLNMEFCRFVMSLGNGKFFVCLEAFHDGEDDDRLLLFCIFSVNSRSIVWLKDVTDFFLGYESSMNDVSITGKESGNGYVINVSGVFSASDCMVRCNVAKGTWDYPEEGQVKVSSLELLSWVDMKSTASSEGFATVGYDREIMLTTHLAFYQAPFINASDGASPSWQLRIDPKGHILAFEAIGGAHLLVLCALAERRSNDHLDIDGTWFHDDQNDQELERELSWSMYAIVVHIPTRQEVRRVYWGDLSSFTSTEDMSDEFQSSIYFIVTGTAESLAVEANTLGLVLAGKDIWRAERRSKAKSKADILSSSGKKEKRKKLQPSKQKNGFKGQKICYR